MRRLAAAFLTIAASVAALFCLAGPAGAFGGEQGILRIHGYGSVFAGNVAFVSEETTAGGTVSYALQVQNTGATTSQYVVRVFITSFSCDNTGCPEPVVTLLAGSTDVTSSARSSSTGYYTAPVAAGKTTPLTMKVKVPKTGLPAGAYFAFVQLLDTAGNVLASHSTETMITATTGTAADDMFVTPTGGKSVRDNGGLDPFLTTANPKLGGTSKFTVKLANDSTTSNQINLKLSDASGCAGQYPIALKVGTADVTSLAKSAAGYTTPVLASKKFTTLTATVTYLTNGCPATFQEWQLQVGTHVAYLVVNAAG